MEKKNIDWSSIGFGYMPTDYRYVSMYQNGSWDEGALTSDPNITLNECACVLQYAQTCFEGLKAYTTEDGHIVTFRPDLNGERMENSAKGLEMPPFPKERFVDAITKVVEANAAFVPPYGSGATLYIRPYGSADTYQDRGDRRRKRYLYHQRRQVGNSEVQQHPSVYHTPFHSAGCKRLPWHGDRRA